MRILFLTHRLPYSPNRGDRIRAYYLMREMSRFAEVSVFSLVHDDEEAAEINRLPFAHDATGVRVTRLRNLVRGAVSLPSRRPLTHALLDAPDALAALARLQSKPPDLVVAYCSGMARFALQTPLSDRPFVLDLVDVDSAKWAQLATVTDVWHRWLYRREAATLRDFEVRATERAEITLVVNDQERDRLRQIAPHARTAVVMNGIDLQAFRSPEPPVNAPVVIFCGVMNYYPNDEGVRWFAHEVWPRVRARRPDARFLVVGASPRPAIRALSAKDPSIEIVGQVPEVQPYLWRSAVSVAPLRLARGLQNKVLEALAAGLPTVTARAVWDGLPVDVQPGCLAADDPVAFADAVVNLLDRSPAGRREIAGAARLDRLSWSERLSGLEAILRDAAARRTSAASS